MLGHANYDIVLLDYMMPGINGLTVLQCMQASHPSVPSILMTSHAGSQVAVLALAAGARACPVKPVDPAELDRALQCCVGTTVSVRLHRTTRNEIEVNATGNEPNHISFNNAHEARTNHGG